MSEQARIESIIRGSINDHLVLHKQTEKTDRCRIDILVEEAAIKILDYQELNAQLKK